MFTMSHLEHCYRQLNKLNLVNLLSLDGSWWHVGNKYAFHLEGFGSSFGGSKPESRTFRIYGCWNDMKSSPAKCGLKESQSDRDLKLSSGSARNRRC